MGGAESKEQARNKQGTCKELRHYYGDMRALPGRWRCSCSAGRAGQVRLSRTLAELPEVLDAVGKTWLRAEGVVLVLDAQHAMIAGPTQLADVVTPLDVTVTRYHISPPTVTEDADEVAPWDINEAVLGVRVEDALAETVDGDGDVQLLVNKMGGVVIPAEIRVGDGFQQAIESVYALEAGSEPILDGDLNAFVFGVAHDRAEDAGDDLLDHGNPVHARTRQAGDHADGGHAQQGGGIN